MAKTQIKGGVFHDGKGHQFTTLDDALAFNTKCGCGLNCKKGYLVLPNFNPASGDVDEFFAIYVVDGSIVTSTIAEAEAAINAFCLDADVSATSVTIGNCLPATPLAALATRQLTKTVLPTGSVQTGTWSTSDALVATVSVGGLVTAVASGTATITFTTTDGGFTATCVITVS